MSPVRMEYTIIIDMVHLLKKYIIDYKFGRMYVCMYVYTVKNVYTQHIYTRGN